MSPRTVDSPPHFLVFVPGYMGSQLLDRATGELAWIDLERIVANPFKIGEALDRFFATLAYPNDNLVPAGIVDQVVFAPPLFKQEHYGRIVEALAGLGYAVDPPAPAADTPALYTFPYDWRQDNRISARQLGQKIDEWRARHPGAQAWIIAHSNGGVVARWYIEKEGGKEADGGAPKVGRLFLLASPWDGAPQAMNAIWNGLEIMFMRKLNLFDIGRRTRTVIRTFPSAYQLIPHHRQFLRDAGNQFVDPFGDPRWLDTAQQRQLALEGRLFNQELGTDLSVETLCLFGSKRATVTNGLIRRSVGGRWSGVTWEAAEAGDGTVTEHSAVHKRAREIHPYPVDHGNIYVNPAVLEKLEWELVRKYETLELAEVVTAELKVMFEPSKDAFAPGETIAFWATVERTKTALPVHDAQVQVTLSWREALPVGEDVTPPEPSTTQLRASFVESGRYEGELVAPEVEGYYALHAVVEVTGLPPVEVDELILIEQVPDPAQLLSIAQTDTPSTPPDTPSADQTGSSGTQNHTPTHAPSEWDDTRKGLEGLFDEDDFGKDVDFALESMDDDDFTPKSVDIGGDGLESLPPSDWDEGRRGFDAPVGADDFTKDFADLDFAVQGDDEPVPTAQADAVESRWINADIYDHDMQRPLKLGETYTLAVYVDTKAAEAAVALDTQRVFRPNEEMVELVAILRSKDFHVYTMEPQRLRVPRAGKSKNKARFDIEPMHNGVGEVTIAFYKDNNFIQDMTLQLGVGDMQPKAILGVETLGRSPEIAFPVQPRDVSLVIKERGSGFDVMLVDSGWMEATLKLTLPQLDRMIARVRTALQGIVDQRDLEEGIRRYQKQIEIPEAMHKDALSKLARAGWQLYQGIFYADNAGADARLMGDKLRQLAEQSTLKIQIVSERFLMPWGVLYLAERFDADNVDWECFLGFKHIIEHIPLATRGQVSTPEIVSQPRLSVSLNLNTDIDEEMELTVVGDQVTYWEQIQTAQGSTAQVKVRKTGAEIKTALSSQDIDDQIVYFYCHAVPYQLEHPDGPDGSFLRLTGQEDLSVADLRFDAPTSQLFPGAPLVFINACESADLSPLFYGGFMPYFTAKGARGVIGTECKVPALFAAEWARRFFNRFLAGHQSVGQVFLDLRREFYQKERNILGLLYALYCDGDTRIVPGLRLTQ